MSTVTDEHRSSGHAINPGHDETVLVTGATRVLGRWLIVELLERGYRVRVTVRDFAREPRFHDALTAVIDETP